MRQLKGRLSASGRITVNLDENDCPKCGTLLDATTGARPTALPNPGDPTVCYKCGEILVFNEKFQPRMPTENELAILTFSSIWPQVIEMQAMVRKMRAEENLRA